MHRILHRSPLTSRFGSMFYGALELNGVFISVNAGHPPPFHLAASGMVTWLEAGGPVLGPLAEASYERGFVIMKPGDLLVFYTDGIVETRGHAQPGAPREEYGTARLVEAAREAQGRSAQAVVQAGFSPIESLNRRPPPSHQRHRHGGHPP